MIVYRVEHKTDGFGPYCRSEMQSPMKTNDRTSSEKHPGPQSDGIELMDHMSNYKFGFRDEYQLKEWFEEYFPKLHKDYHITKYDVPHQFVFQGNKQVAYEYKYATLIGMEPIL